MEIFSQKNSELVNSKFFKSLPKEAQKRYRTIVLWQEFKANKTPESLILKSLNVSRATIYRWLKLFDLRSFNGLESESRRPNRLRKALKQRHLEPFALKMRQEYPIFGKHKIKAMLLEDLGMNASAGTIGLIISKLIREKKVQHSYYVCGKRIRKRRKLNGHAQRFEYGMKAEKLGEMMQIDHMSVGIFKHFSIACPTSKMNCSYAYRQATASNAADFLRRAMLYFPFAIRSIQADGGSEFMADFEQFCKKIRLPLFILPPRSPKLNGCVERSNGTFRYEFYSQHPTFRKLSDLNRELSLFCLFYNEKRPHQRLNYSTPVRYLKERKVLPGNFEQKSLICIYP